MSISDRDWFGIRAAAHRLDWEEVAQRADELGWPLVSKHARRVMFDPSGAASDVMVSVGGAGLSDRERALARMAVDPPHQDRNGQEA